MRKALIIFTILLGCCTTLYSKDYADTSALAKPKQSKELFFKKIMKPIKWIGNNWSAYDPEYSTPAAYNWVVQAQNTSSMEWLNMSTDNGTEIKMRSKASHKIGPYLGYQFLVYGYTVDINALKGTNRRNEFTLSINCNLINMDFIRRRTGGDFMTRRLVEGFQDPVTKQTSSFDMTTEARTIVNNSDVGEVVDNDITGFNLNYFTNHKKYSNPAAFTNGAIQIKSAGSCILGIGYTRQKVSSDASDAIINCGMSQIMENSDNITEDVQDELYRLAVETTGRSFNGFMDFSEYISELYYTDIDAYKNILARIYNNKVLQPFLFGKFNEDGTHKDYGILPVISNAMPSVTTIDDWSLHFGYAYNLVLSRRLLLGVSVIASPGIKQVKYDNRWSLIGVTANELAEAINSYYGTPGYYKSSDFNINRKYTHASCNFFGRCSLTYTHNKWLAGINANTTVWLLRSHEIDITNAYGAASVYVGYFFNLKKLYRKGGKDHDTFLKVIK